jgi:hypothetical protein
VGGSIVDVNTVATNISNVNTVAGIDANVTLVGNSAADVNTVAGDIADVTTVASNIADVNTVATDIANVNTTATNIADVNTVAAELGVGQDVTVVAANIADVSTVSTNIADVNTVADALATPLSAANAVSYDPATSGLTATDVQAAIDEVEGGLGTAAALTATTSDTDGTEGSVARIGDFGLGSRGVLPTNNDCDDTVLNGVYRIASTTANTPGGTGPSGSVLVVFKYSDNDMYQMFFLRQAGTPEVWVRHMYLGTWQDWARDYNATNIVGTVSQTAGVPTGAIIESGSNANGEYVKFADGTLMCWQEWAVESMADYTTREETWTFPVAYTAAPNLSATGVRDATEATKGLETWFLNDVTTTAADVVVYNGSGTSSDGCGISAQAHGFWY